MTSYRQKPLWRDPPLGGLLVRVCRLLGLRLEPPTLSLAATDSSLSNRLLAAVARPTCAPFMLKRIKGAATVTTWP